MKKPRRRVVPVNLMKINAYSSLSEFARIIASAEALFPEYTDKRFVPSNTGAHILIIWGDRPQTDAEYALYCDYVAAEEAGAREHEQKERAEYERLKAIFGDE